MEKMACQKHENQQERRLERTTALSMVTLVCDLKHAFEYSSAKIPQKGNTEPFDKEILGSDEMLKRLIEIAVGLAQADDNFLVVHPGGVFTQCMVFR